MFKKLGKALKKAGKWVWDNKGKVVEVIKDLYEAWKNRHKTE